MIRRFQSTGAAPVLLGLLLGSLLVLPANLPAQSDLQDQKLDLNSATFEDLLALPMPPDLAQRILDHRTYVRYFENLFDLMDVDGMTPEQLAVLRPLVSTLPPEPEDLSIARLAASYRQARWFLGQEGANEGLVDEYLDQLRDPVNVNDLDLFDLMSYQHVSPVDATNILKARKNLGGFEDTRQLRRSSGVRYWAYRNLRDFVVFSDEEITGGRPEKAGGSYEWRFYDTPYSGDEEEVMTAAHVPYSWQTWTPADTLNITRGTANFRPSMTHKLRLNLTGGLKAGFLTHRNFGQESWRHTLKGFLGLNNKELGPFRLKRLYFGNYRVAFGLGLIMDNTDFVLFRKTGYGWNKRPVGVRGDLSRSREFALTGGAMEGRIGPFHTTLFWSEGKKDGILNPDGTVNQYISIKPWPTDEFLEQHLSYSNRPTGVTRKAFEEKIVGGNVKLMLGTGSFIGLTGYEARYDRAFRSDVHELVRPADWDLLQARDSEISEGYTSVFVDPASQDTSRYDFRTVLGAEFQTVIQNVAIQGEYAWLQDPREPVLRGDLGDAFIINAFTQFDDLHLLATYRDYDIGYDNPYNRAFSNDTRFEMTLLDSWYRLNDPLYSYLELEMPQPKAERGIFFDARYRISRNLILAGLQFDQWERKADGMDMQRWTLKAEYQPIWNLRLRVRQRFSSRSENLPIDVRAFHNWETRWQLVTLLSNYNRLSFMYMTSNVQFPARQRLSFPPDPGNIGSGLGLAADPSSAFEVRYEHNLTPWIRLLGAATMVDGFLWNFEGNEFVLIDEKGFRTWFKVESRLSDRMLMQLKVTRDHNLPQTWVDVRRFGQPSGEEPDATWVPRDQTFFRLIFDYSF